MSTSDSIPAPVADPRVVRLHHALDEARELVTARVEHTIQELHQALAFAASARQPVGDQLAEMVLGQVIPDGQPPVIVPTVMAVAAEFFEVTVGELCGPGRTKQLARARQIAMYLCRVMAGVSLPRIGRSFGGRDHTTVLHAHRKVSQEIAEGGPAGGPVADLTVLITRRAAMAGLRRCGATGRITGGGGARGER